MFDELEAMASKLAWRISISALKIFWRPALVGMAIYYAFTQFLYITLGLATVVLIALTVRWYLIQAKDPS